MEEYILVFPSDILHRIGYFQGLSFEPEKYLSVALDPDVCFFKRRSEAENDPAYKQIIPYVLLVYKGKIVSYLRGKLLKEERLLGKYSIGVGGHVSTRDPSLFGSAYESGLHREVEEEIVISSTESERTVAVLNDDSDDVGRVHLGVIHVWKLQGSSVKAREKSIRDVRLRSINEVRREIDKYENWSRICIEELEKLVGPE